MWLGVRMQSGLTCVWFAFLVAMEGCEGCELDDVRS